MRIIENMKEIKAPAYTDLDLMPFGKYKGTILQEVPASYLLWLWDEGKNRDVKMDNYIYNCLSHLKDECPDKIIKRI